MDRNDPGSPAPDATVLELRKFSRRLVRELGFMRATLADTDLAPSAVHAVIEIGTSPGINARDLGQILRLDKSNTSRQLARLETSGFIRREADDDDGRSSALHLTHEGQKLRRRIDQFATNQVSNALRRMVPADQQALVRSLALYSDALAAGSDSSAMAQDASAGITQGLQPGCIGDIVGLHGRFYSKHWGFGVFFESKIATALAEFAATLPMEGKALWLHRQHDRVLASLAIDANLTTGMAHLRWFIVDESLQGAGIGRQLMARAMQFVDHHRLETYLCTFKGLDAARHLYESFGFRLTQESAGTQWGTPVIEQRFDRGRAG